MQGRVLLILFVLYFVYLCIGAAVFWAIEFNNEKQLCQQTITQLEKYNLSDVNSDVHFKNGSIRNLVQVPLLIYNVGNIKQFL